MEADVAQKRSAVVLNNGRQLAAFRESPIFPGFGPPSRQVEGCSFSGTLGFQRAPEAVCLQFIVIPKNTFLK